MQTPHVPRYWLIKWIANANARSQIEIGKIQKIQNQIKEIEREIICCYKRDYPTKIVRMCATLPYSVQAVMFVRKN